jgi:hypothetical protein
MLLMVAKIIVTLIYTMIPTHFFVLACCTGCWECIGGDSACNCCFSLPAIAVSCYVATNVFVKVALVEPVYVIAPVFFISSMCMWSVCGTPKKLKQLFYMEVPSCYTCPYKVCSVHQFTYETCLKFFRDEFDVIWAPEGGECDAMYLLLCIDCRNRMVAMYHGKHPVLLTEDEAVRLFHFQVKAGQRIRAEVLPIKGGFSGSRDEFRDRIAEFTPPQVDGFEDKCSMDGIVFPVNATDNIYYYDTDNSIVMVSSNDGVSQPVVGLAGPSTVAVPAAVNNRKVIPLPPQSPPRPPPGGPRPPPGRPRPPSINDDTDEIV